jgi:hypothetical protein
MLGGLKHGRSLVLSTGERRLPAAEKVSFDDILFGGGQSAHEGVERATV